MSKKPPQRSRASREPNANDELVNSIMASATGHPTQSPVSGLPHVPFEHADWAGLVQQNQLDVANLVQRYKAEIEQLTGHQIHVERGIVAEKRDGLSRAAWKNNTAFHLVMIRPDYPRQWASHLESHEFTHLKLEYEAIKVGKNRGAVRSESEDAVILQSLMDEFNPWLEEMEPQEVAGKALSLISYTKGSLYSRPIDVVIEQFLYSNFPLLRPVQFYSTQYMATYHAPFHLNPRNRRLAPRKILRAHIALGGAYALFLDDLFGGVSQLGATFASEEDFGLAHRVWKHWKERLPAVGPGDEYKLVDETADLLGLNGWFHWIPANEC